jgi:hypothetical protein
MVFFGAVTIGASAAAFTIGWFNGYNKACRAHGWYLPQAASKAGQVGGR